MGSPNSRGLIIRHVIFARLRAKHKTLGGFQRLSRSILLEYAYELAGLSAQIVDGEHGSDAARERSDDECDHVVVRHGTAFQRWVSL
jgi:hypothetical protein